MRPFGLYFVCLGSLCSPFLRFRNKDSYVSPSSKRTISTFLENHTGSFVNQQMKVSIYAPSVRSESSGKQRELLVERH